jgi:hypothetical protein
MQQQLLLLLLLLYLTASVGGRCGCATHILPCAAVCCSVMIKLCCGP